MKLLTGKEVKQYREQAKLSQAKLGKEINKSGGWVSAIENGYQHVTMGDEVNRRLRVLFKLDDPSARVRKPILNLGEPAVIIEPAKVTIKTPVTQHSSITNDAIKSFEAMQEEATKKIKEQTERKVDLADELEHLCADIIKQKHILLYCKTAVEAMKK